MKLNNPKVQILMSTYNGEKYLLEQLESLFNQKKVDVSVLIRDDGSDDLTVNIIKKMMDRYPIELIQGENIGYTDSFMNLIYESKYKDFDYLAFCDQDDVWLDDKVINAINLMKLSKREDKLVFTALTFVNSKLEPFGKRSYKKYNISLGSAMTLSSIAGCTLVLNKSLSKKIANYSITVPDGVGHDGWVFRFALLIDASVIYDDNSRILFRRHASNESTGGKKIIGKIKNFVSLFTKYRNMQFKIASIMRELNLQVSESNKFLLNEIYIYKFKTVNTIRLIFNKSLNTGNLVNDLLIRITILFHVY